MDVVVVLLKELLAIPYILRPFLEGISQFHKKRHSKGVFYRGVCRQRL